MANLQETPTWETGIYQFEITDPVLGGPDGIDNVPTRQLANRTAYLKQQNEATNANVSSMGTRLSNVESTNVSQNNRLSNVENTVTGIKNGTEDLTTQPKGSDNRKAATTEFVMNNRGGMSGFGVFNASSIITASMAGNSLISNWSGNITLTIDLISKFRLGDSLTFTKMGPGVLKIVIPDLVVSPGGLKNEIYLYNGESVQIVNIDSSWLLISDTSNMSEVGLVVSAHHLIHGCIELNGSLVSREAYPRLWKYAQTTNIVQDVSWGFSNKGCFSTGDGSTTFRLPDFRDVFIRSKSASRTVGSYEADALASHNHLGVPGNQGGPFNQIGTSPGSFYKLDGTGYTNSTGEANETRPKNIALLQMIKY